MNSFPIIKFLYSNIYQDSKKSNMETSYEVITRLKYIGMIKKGEKINTKTLDIQPDTLYTSVLRMFNQESRSTTLDFLTSVINRSFELIQLYTTGNNLSDLCLCKNLIRDIVCSTKGLLNIQETYKHDRLFYCHLDTLIQSIDVKLKHLKEKRSDLFDLNEEKNEEEE